MEYLWTGGTRLLAVDPLAHTVSAFRVTESQEVHVHLCLQRMGEGGMDERWCLVPAKKYTVILNAGVAFPALVAIVMARK